MERIKEIFQKIKEGHTFWVNGDSNLKDRIEKAFAPYFDELETLGVAREFSETLLFFGKEFVDTLNVKKNNIDAELTFGADSTPLTEIEIKRSDLARKYNALAYKVIETKDSKASIKVLTYIKK